MTALVIDASKLMRMLLRQLLVHRGFEVIDFPTLSSLPSCTYNADVAFVEWELSNPDLPAFISRARRQWASRSLLVVLASSQPEPRIVLQARMCGADHVLAKPFTSAQLEDALAGCQAGISMTAA